MDSNNILGKENIGKLLLKMVIPAVIAQMVTLLYNVMDRMFLSSINGIGQEALAGVGVTIPIIIIISAFASLIGIGGAPRLAIKMGEGKYEEAEEILSNCFISLIFTSIVLTVFFLIFNNKLLILFGASEHTLLYAENYINVYVMGTIFVQITIGLNIFITSQGFANIGMKTMLIASGLNILLDFLFIKVLGFGVFGASLATVISQGVAAFWVLKFLMSDKSRVRINKKYFKVKKEVMLPILFLGLAPFIMQLTESLLNIAFNSSLKKYGGDIAVGSMTIIGTIMQCIGLITTGIGQGTQPIISFNYGAKNIDRVNKACKLMILIMFVFTSIMWVIFMFKSDLLVGIFLKDSDPMKLYAVDCLRVYMLACFIIGLQFACQQCFVALGQAKVSLFLALFRKVILLIPFIYILPNILSDSFILHIQKGLFEVSLDNKVFSVFLAEPLADFIAAITTTTLFVIIIKKLNKNVKY